MANLLESLGEVASLMIAGRASWTSFGGPFSYESGATSGSINCHTPTFTPLSLIHIRKHRRMRNALHEAQCGRVFAHQIVQEGHGEFGRVQAQQGVAAAREQAGQAAQQAGIALGGDDVALLVAGLGRSRFMHPAAGRSHLPYPLFLNPDAIPLIVMWMPVASRGLPSPAR